jgi:hypothetical protein
MSATSTAAIVTKESPASSVDQFPPVVLDLGKTKKKLIKALKEGEGKLMEDVTHAMEAVRSNLGAEVEGKILVPIVIVYEKKAARKSGLLPFSF